MDHQRDEFVIRYDVNRGELAELIAASEKAGFPAHVVAEPGRAKDPAFFQQALARAHTEDKLVILDFTASWCAPCQRMLTETFPDPNVARLLEQCVLIKVDTDDYPDVANTV